MRKVNVLTEEQIQSAADCCVHPCTEKNMAFRNMYTMLVEKEVSWLDVRQAVEKKQIWFLTEEEAEYVMFYIRMEAFKIYAKEWVGWVSKWSIKGWEIGLEVRINC